jgi:hypothetical protein
MAVATRAAEKLKFMLRRAKGAPLETVLDPSTWASDGVLVLAVRSPDGALVAFGKAVGGTRKVCTDSSDRASVARGDAGDDANAAAVVIHVEARCPDSPGCVITGKLSRLNSEPHDGFGASEGSSSGISTRSRWRSGGVSGRLAVMLIVHVPAITNWIFAR